MKKLFLLLVVFLMVFTSNSEAIRLPTITLKSEFGYDVQNDCKGFGICYFTVSVGIVKGSTDDHSQTMQVIGEIRNDLFILTLPTEMDEKGRNQQGKFVFSLSKEMIVGQDLAKELGVDKLVLAPGKYELKGNTVSFKIVSPRDAATGQSSGKRSDIAIKEQGVRKEAAPKATSDQKEKLEKNDTF